ncbi:DUF1156 domain-containing protein [Desulfobacter latus]|uniref:site-specific DNA-methyltransferase (adenine-specific) n=1 Tax=Desulfobacter latus TaxID=2292 RepID=A0A850TCU2_9BACT|nr:DUF1156 domain-containing protein [Desulfobacter latus]NWH06598.1 DUF1156 domain-containing protein [Desulfobacter latus]
MDLSYQDDLRLIEAGFPCHQVGAETQRERGASSALPPLYFLHVWWARRPLTPSRAAILASLLPADTNPDWFIKQLGLKKRVININGISCTLTGKALDKIQTDETNQEVLPVDTAVLNYLEKENTRIQKNIRLINRLKESDPSIQHDPILIKWEAELKEIPRPFPKPGEELIVKQIPADPSWAKTRIEWENKHKIRTQEDKYGYARAFSASPVASETTGLTVLDPTSGGGSIPFEALRLGHNVIANDLNPVACVILNATLKYPSLFGLPLLENIETWGNKLRSAMVDRIERFFPCDKIPNSEKKHLDQLLINAPDLVDNYLDETLDGFLYYRQVTCPHCGGDAPLLNTCWLSKEAGKQWGVKIIPDGKSEGGSVGFETFRAEKGKGPHGEDAEFATVKRGVGLCIHCKQAITPDEIKAQARGESENGTWKDRLYCVVGVRFQPKLDKQGQIQRYKSGARKGEVKTEKIRYFRPPNSNDLNALDQAEKELDKNWDHWDDLGLIPTEKFPQGNDMRPKIYGMPRWCDMFTPRQLLGHLTLMEELNRLQPRILEQEGEKKGKAIITYLQFAIDKGVDYNSRQTRWIAQRGQVSGTFGRHDFSLKWTFGEMIFTGPRSGAAWGLSQVLDAYKGIAELTGKKKHPVTITNGSAANLSKIKPSSVDLVCMDPPYYNNVQYAELSDFYYVWQKRSLKNLYPEYFSRRLTNKTDEAVANPDRDGGTKPAKDTYEKMMGEIFAECRRVLKDSGIMTMMFTHKSQDAWETLTRSLIEHGWIISAAFPVDSEFANSQNIMNNASASSSIFLACRKRQTTSDEPATWTGFGGTGVQQKIRTSVKQGLKDFETLKLNPVDEMVACYGKALSVLSEQWPVLDGDEPVGPIRAMNEASRVVAENQISRITGGKLSINDMAPEAAMALTLYGIYGLGDLPYDEALNLSRSLNIKLEAKTGGYTVDDRFIGINTQSTTRRSNQAAKAEDLGFHAPLLRKGSKLRLALPEERNPKRLEHPQTEWDLLHGLIVQYRQGDIPLVRAYMTRHAEGKEDILMHLLSVWTAETGDENLRKEGNTILFGLK